MTDLERAILHIKTRADAWAVKEVTEALQSISERMDKALSQEPCEDAISREAVIMECIKYADHEHNVRVKKEVSEERKHDAQVIIYACDYFKTFVEKLPSVTQKSGKWIDREVYDADRWKCSICGRTEQYQERYCPNCGAKMESEDKE